MGSFICHVSVTFAPTRAHTSASIRQSVNLQTISGVVGVS